MRARQFVFGAAVVLGWFLLAALRSSILAWVVAVLATVAVAELRAVVNQKQVRLAVEAGYPIAFAFVYAAYQFADDAESFGLATLSLMLLLVLGAFSKNLAEGGTSPTANVALTVLACVYCGLLTSTIVLVRGYQPNLVETVAFGRNWPLGQRLLFFLLLTTFTADGVADLCDRLIGRHKLEHSPLPARSFEGLAGAAVAGAVAALVAGWLFHIGVMQTPSMTIEAYRRASALHCLTLGALLGLVAQSARFAAAVLKREAGVDQFGWYLPGYGGALDHLQSLLFTAPVLYLYIQFVAG